MQTQPQDFLPTTLEGWVTISVMVIGWIVSLVTLWNKLTDKVNGQGKRIQEVEKSYTGQEARMDRVERDLESYRRDQADVAGRLGRVEKGMEELHETIHNGNLALGSQLHGIEKMIQEQDKKIQVRLTRIETVNQIERKIGPIQGDRDE